MLWLLGIGERLYPEFDVAFLSNPDKSQGDDPSDEQVRQASKTVNTELWKGLEKMSCPTGSSGTLPYRKKILRRTLRAIASPSC